MRNVMWTLSAGLVLCLATTATAQPGGGGRGPGGPGGPRPTAEDGKLAAALEKIDARLNELEKKVNAPKPGVIAGPAFGGATGGMTARPPFSRGPIVGTSGPGMSRGPGPMGGPHFGGPGPHHDTRPSPAGHGPAAAGQMAAARRIDHIIHELEQLKRELSGGGPRR